MPNSIIEHLHAKKILILGFGSEGRSSLAYIEKHINDIQPEKITVADLNFVEINSSIEDIELVIGEDYLDSMQEADIVLKSPGIHFNIFNKKLVDGHWELEEYPGVEITGQMDLLLKYASGNIIGVSGSKGKSTTTSLVYEILKNNFVQTYLLGNIGVPVLDHIDELDENTYAAVEMGVHQLEFTTASPKIAVITNLYPEHLDHYKGYEDYIYSKLNIARWQTEDDILVLAKNEDELLKEVLPLIKESRSQVIFVSDEEKDVNSELAEQFTSIDDFVFLAGETDNGYRYSHADEINSLKNSPNLLGRHNILDALLAIAASSRFDVDLSALAEAVAGYEGLEHRLEYVGEFKGIKFYNDSIATIQEACKLAIKALKSVGELKVLLIGGLDRGLDYRDLVKFFYSSSIDTLVCLPDTGEKIKQLVEEYNLTEERKIKAITASTMEIAVSLAYENASSGDIVLMSPAAASYNQYKNFADRGEAFKREISAQANI